MAKGLTRCNVCGKTVEQVFEGQMVISIHDRVGYGSKHDGSMLDLDICSDCFDKLIDRKRIFRIRRNLRNERYS